MASDALVDRKWMSRERLIEVLAGVPAGALLSPNLVGNLKVSRAAPDGTPGDYIGYVDFLFEEWKANP
jgi:hypothetical protein